MQRAAAAAPLPPGTLLVGRYEIERELGRGGMAVVYLAQDLKHERPVAVKVLHAELASALASERFLREIRTAAQLSHPHILPLHDSGESEGGALFYVMPYVAGETLRQRMRRVGPLPVDEAVRVAGEVAGALEYAHGQGIVHRDIKPENILLQDGHAVVADFGIARAVSQAAGGDARALTGTGLALGTPAYMSPEQATGETPVDGRADVYALGCVLYEMLTGEPPHTGPTPQAVIARRLAEPPRPIRTVRDTVPQGVEAAALRALARVPADRFASAGAFRDALLAPTTAGTGTAPDRRPRRRMLIASGLLVLAAAGGAAYLFLRDRGGASTGSPAAAAAPVVRERIFVADFRSPASDSALGPLVAEAIRIDLAQSPTVSAVSPASARDILQRMGHRAGVPVHFDAAREVARLQGVKAILDGEVALVGGRYVLSARLVATQTGEGVAAFREEAADSSEVLEAVGRLSRRLRLEAGESVRSVQSSSSLTRVTTGSLEAIGKYVDAHRATIERGDGDAYVKLLEEAVAIDSNFAVALVDLGYALFDRGQRARGAALIARAYALRARLTPAERYRVEAMYFQRGPNPDFSRAISAYESLVRLQPPPPDGMEAQARTQGSILYAERREFAAAESLLKRVHVVHPRPATSHFSNFISYLVAQGKLREAEQSAERMAAQRPGLPNTIYTHVALAVGRGQYDSAQAMLERLRVSRPADQRVRDQTGVRLADLALIRGRVRDARRWRRDARDALAAEGGPAAPLLAAVDDAIIDVWLLGDTARALRAVSAALVRHPLDSLRPADRPYAELARLYALAGRTAEARVMLAGHAQSRPDGRVTDLTTRLRTLGEILTAEGQYDEAVRALRESDQGSCLTCALPRLALAYDLAGNADSAVAVFTRYIEMPHYNRLTVDAFYLAGAHKRLGELHEARGNRAAAAAHYARFAELWKDADPELQPRVAEVRRRLTMLRGAEGR